MVPGPQAIMSPLARRRHPPANTSQRFRPVFLTLLIVASALVQLAQGTRRSQAQVKPSTGAVAAEQTTVFQVATRKLEELATREGLISRQEMLTRNLSRYFVVYLVPPDADETQRVLGTAQRMTLQGARLFYRAARSVAEKSGAGQIERAHVEAALAALLPEQRSEWDERIFFPASGPTPLETWDLEALLDTGLAWEVLGSLADIEVASAEQPLLMSPDAAERLAEGINAYGLLLFRLGGEHARAELAPHLRTQHLRLAGKTVAARGGGNPSPIGDQPPLAQPRGSHFEDITSASGLDFRHSTADWLDRQRRYGPIAPTFSGGGAAAADLDGDDWADVVVCGGFGCEVLVNLRSPRGRLEPKPSSGATVAGEARMPILADFDNDGDRDLFVTYARDTNRLFLNRGDGTFVDSTQGSGLERDGDISGPAAAVDVDGDGLLDLYVGNFGNYLQGDSAWVANDAKNAMPNRLYRNLGLGDQGQIRFEDISAQAGVEDRGWAQALSHLDVDLDGDQDLYIANDFGRNQLLLNRGDGRFQPAGSETSSDDPFHGMNVSFADLNHDGYGDIFITNIWFWSSASREVTETNTLLLSSVSGGELGYERSEDPGLLAPDTGWAWAAAFFDVENDGDDDLAVLNGFTDYMTFVQYREHPERPGLLYPIHNARDPNFLFLGDGGVPDRAVAGSGLELEGINSRSLALLDVDRDGDLDALVTTFHDRARLLRNVSTEASDARQNRWLHRRRSRAFARGPARPRTAGRR